MKFLFLMILLLGTSFNSYAVEDKEGGSGAHGGDTYALEFVSDAQAAALLIQKKCADKFPEFNVVEVLKTIPTVKVVTVEKTVLNGDETDFLNYPERKRIEINGGRWSKLTANDLLKKYAVSLHEFLGILKVELDVYVITSRLLPIFEEGKINPAVAIASIEKITTKFDSAKKPALEKLTVEKTWTCTITNAIPGAYASIKNVPQYRFFERGAHVFEEISERTYTNSSGGFTSKYMTETSPFEEELRMTSDGTLISQTRTPDEVFQYRVCTTFVDDLTDRVMSLSKPMIRVLKQDNTAATIALFEKIKTTPEYKSCMKKKTLFHTKGKRNDACGKLVEQTLAIKEFLPTDKDTVEIEAQVEKCNRWYDTLKSANEKRIAKEKIKSIIDSYTKARTDLTRWMNEHKTAMYDDCNKIRDIGESIACAFDKTKSYLELDFPLTRQTKEKELRTKLDAVLLELQSIEYEP